jgi:hypothetical protein
LNGRPQAETHAQPNKTEAENKGSETKAPIGAPLFAICLLGAHAYFYVFHGKFADLRALIVAGVAWLVVDFIVRAHRRSK